MNTVTVLDKDIPFASTWDELTKDQFLFVAQMLFTGIDHERVKHYLSISALNFHRRLFNYNGKTHFVPGFANKFQLLAFRKITRKKSRVVDPEDIYFISQLFNFLFVKTTDKEKNEIFHRNVLITKNHMPVIRHRFKTLYGPKDYMADSTVAEYIAAENHYQAFLANPEIIHLNLLCAALYRKAKQTIFSRKKTRIDFDDDYTLSEPLFNKIPAWQRFAILLFFEGVRNNLVNDFPYIFSRPAEGETTPADPHHEQDSEDHSWPAVISSIAGHVTQIESVLNVNMHTFFFNINHQVYTQKNAPKQK